jgi:hypothetical protein
MTVSEGTARGPTEIGESERYEVAWCTDQGFGTRTIPPGAIKGAHWVQTPSYVRLGASIHDFANVCMQVQITGFGDFTTMNVKAGDSGGELDPRGSILIPVGSI